jgi:hypothetical protein
MVEFKSRRRHLPERERHAQDRRDGERQEAARRAQRVREAAYDDPRRLDNAAQAQRLATGAAVPQGATAFSGAVTPQTDPRMAIDFAMKVFEAIKLEVRDAGEAARIFGERHPDLVPAYRAATSLLAAQRPVHQSTAVTSPPEGAATRQFASLVEAHVRQHGTSYGDAIMEVSRTHRELTEQRNRELTPAIGAGGIALADR